MRGLRYWVAGMCLWLFFFYNIERLGHQLNIASFVYVYVALCVVLLIALWPQLHKISLVWLFIVVLIFYVLLKIFFGYRIGGPALTITVTEVAALWLTTVLARRISINLAEVEKTISDLVIGRMSPGTDPFEHGQERLYSEIRRARLYERPAAVLAITAVPTSTLESFDRFAQKVQKEIVDRYIEAQVARLLVEVLKDCDIITQKNNHFITLLPETGESDLTQVIQQLKTAAHERLGLQFAIGYSTFPDESVTFESLLTLAEERMQQAGDTAPDQAWRSWFGYSNTAETSKEA